jgi:hypothetical protein
MAPVLRPRHAEVRFEPAHPRLTTRDCRPMPND